MRKLNILLLTVASIILLISLNVQRQHTITEETKTVGDIPERVEVVEGEEEEERDTQHNDIRSIESSYDTQTEIQAYIKGVFGEDSKWGIGVAICESSLNRSAVSPSGKYKGLYQFSTTTWDTNCDGDREDWRAQVRCAHKLFLRGETWRWPVCGMEKGE